MTLPQPIPTYCKDTNPEEHKKRMLVMVRVKIECIHLADSKCWRQEGVGLLGGKRVAGVIESFLEAEMMVVEGRDVI